MKYNSVPLQYFLEFCSIGKPRFIKLLLVISLITATTPTEISAYANLGDSLSAEARLSIVTVGPADPLFTTFGHTAIRIRDPLHHIDRIYNYGTFNPETDQFIFKFLRGTLRYYLSRQTFDSFQRRQQKLNRTIRELVLNLEKTKLERLFHQLETQVGNSYTYRFFQRNCVTKVRDLLKRRQIITRSGFPDLNDHYTYRRLMNPYLDKKPWLKAGINTLLGKKVDQSISRWETLGLPLYFHRALQEYKTQNHKPLVAKSRVIYIPDTENAASFPVPPLYMTSFLGILFILPATLSGDKQKVLQSDYVLFGSMGLLGTIMLAFHLGSYHPALRFNLNMVWMLPSLLIAVRLISINLWKRYGRIILSALILGQLFGLYIGLSSLQTLPTALYPLILTQLIRSVSLLYGKYPSPSFKNAF